MASSAHATMYAVPSAELQRRPADYQLKTWDYDSICSMQQQAQQDHEVHARSAQLFFQFLPFFLLSSNGEPEGGCKVGARGFDSVTGKTKVGLSVARHCL